MLEQSRLRDYEARCTQESAPRCRLSCPLDMDVRGFLAAMAASRPTLLFFRDKEKKQKKQNSIIGK